MTSRDRVKAALEFHEVDEIPTDRADTAGVAFTYGSGKTAGVEVNCKGIRYDEWGTKWEALEDGVCGEVKENAVDDWAKLDSFQPPYDVLHHADLSSVNAQCKQTERFVIPMWWANYNLFERMQHTRGTERLFYDLAEPTPELYRLRDIIHEYFMYQAEMWVKTDIDALHIADDWGTQNALLISPRMWQEFYKPCYKEYCDLAHKHGKYIVMHSDGNICSILDDLCEIGVNAVNAQLFIMGIEDLADRYHHKMAFWGEFDRQHLLPFGNIEDCKAGVRRVANAFFRYGRTGIVGQAFGAKDIPEENVEAVYSEWKKM